MKDSDKKIIINGRFLIHKITGVERYAREILSELDKLVEPGNVEIAIPPETTDIPDYQNIGIKKIGKLKNRMWEQISLPLYAAKKHGTIFSLCSVAPLVKPDVVCIHDMRTKDRTLPKSHKKLFEWWCDLQFGNSTARGKKIITVSEFSKKEIMKYYGTREQQIVVIPNAWQHYEKTGYDESTLDRYGLQKENYFFSLGSMQPNKNFRWIAECAKRNPKMVFAAAGGINPTVFRNGVDFECPSNMKLLGYVSDEEAKTLMRDCRAFIFPSFYEGFGIPPLEAMSAGAKGIVVSDIEVMHEIFEESVNYVDPGNYEYSMESLKPVSYRERILKKYSWEESARKLYKLMTEVM